MGSRTALEHEAFASQVACLEAQLHSTHIPTPADLEAARKVELSSLEDWRQVYLKRTEPEEGELLAPAQAALNTWLRDSCMQAVDDAVAAVKKVSYPEGQEDRLRVHQAEPSTVAAGAHHSSASTSSQLQQRVQQLRQQLQDRQQARDAVSACLRAMMQPHAEMASRCSALFKRADSVRSNLAAAADQAPSTAVAAPSRFTTQPTITNPRQGCTANVAAASKQTLPSNATAALSNKQTTPAISSHSKHLRSSATDLQLAPVHTAPGRPTVQASRTSRPSFTTTATSSQHQPGAVCDRQRSSYEEMIAGGLDDCINEPCALKQPVAASISRQHSSQPDAPKVPCYLQAAASHPTAAGSGSRSHLASGHDREPVPSRGLSAVMAQRCSGDEEDDERPVKRLKVTTTRLPRRAWAAHQMHPSTSTALLSGTSSNASAAGKPSPISTTTPQPPSRPAPTQTTAACTPTPAAAKPPDIPQHPALHATTAHQSTNQPMVMPPPGPPPVPLTGTSSPSHPATSKVHARSHFRPGSRLRMIPLAGPAACSKESPAPSVPAAAVTPQPSPLSVLADAAAAAAAASTSQHRQCIPAANASSSGNPRPHPPSPANRRPHTTTAIPARKQPSQPFRSGSTGTVMPCQVEGCNQLAVKSQCGLRIRCAAHLLQLGMKPSFRLCAEPGCMKGVNRCERGVRSQYCWSHSRRHGMRPLPWAGGHSTCAAEGCEKWPKPDVQGVRMYCKAHMKELGIVSHPSTHAKCQVGGCGKYAQSATGAAGLCYCFKHMKEKGLEWRKIACQHEGCDKQARASADGPAVYCKAHQREKGMVNGERRCAVEGCDKQAIRDHEGQTRYCVKHMKERGLEVLYVANGRMLCKQEGCKKFSCKAKETGKWEWCPKHLRARGQTAFYDKDVLDAI